MMLPYVHTIIISKHRDNFTFTFYLAVPLLNVQMAYKSRNVKIKLKPNHVVSSGSV